MSSWFRNSGAIESSTLSVGSVESRQSQMMYATIVAEMQTQTIAKTPIFER